jgi:hypothetical protein
LILGEILNEIFTDGIPSDCVDQVPRTPAILSTAYQY